MTNQGDEQKIDHDSSEMTYIPADSEKKRVILVYLLLGFLLLSYGDDSSPDEQKRVYSVFEDHHIHCALGRWACMITACILFGWTLFLPYLGVLSFFLFFSWFVVYGYCLYTTYHGYVSKDNPLTDFLYGLGFRILSLFDKNLPREKDSSIQ